MVKFKVGDKVHCTSNNLRGEIIHNFVGIGDFMYRIKSDNPSHKDITFLAREFEIELDASLQAKDSLHNWLKGS